jgi:hypothetical protein
MNKGQSNKLIVVTGDVTIDWNIANIRRKDSLTHVWNPDNSTCAYCHRGGAAMLAELIEAVAEDLNHTGNIKMEVRRGEWPQGEVTPGDSRFHHSYAIWTPFQQEKRDPSSKKVWRVQDFLGLHRADVGKDTLDSWQKIIDDPDNPDIILLDDAGLGFRDRPEYWPKAILNKTSNPWVLVKMARPIASGKLWEHLRKRHADKLVVVMTADDLRRHTDVRISRHISWERTTQDLVWELLYNSRVNALTQCAHAIVSFNAAGAILLSRKSENVLDAVLYFDPNSMEDEWERQFDGYIIGSTSCLMAGIAREFMVNPSKPNVRRGIQSGIGAMRFLHTAGYGYASNDLRRKPVVFPAADIAAKLKEEFTLAAAPVKNPAQVQPTEETVAEPSTLPHLWTILGDQSPGLFEDIAFKIVREGLERALSDVPVGRFGALATVDRREIEALNCISSLIGEYCQRIEKKPLSIAVFGPPGAGKSFAVSQVANSVRPGEIEALSFNLSQLGGPDALLDAFHQVRDKALSGKIPLVFWDEFDTTLQGQPLGWLRYFLAPMQDGEFREGQIIHPIGRSIFVFAGGTSHRLEAFGAELDEEKRRAIKLPDFVSRVKGFLNILGPNRQISVKNAGGEEDPYYIIRRAILLRSILVRNVPQLLNADGTINIDEGLLRAFLLVKEYRHGARSMETIVTTSQLSGKTSFERSSLPAEAQLNLHVDGSEFYSLVYYLVLSPNQLEKLAEAAHEVFCDDLRAKGYKYGPKTRDDKKVHNSLKPYAELPENEKEQNRNNVRDITNKLASIGYAMLPSRGSVAIGKFTNTEVEKLAEIEHERWMKQKLEEGWKYGEVTDKDKKLNKGVVAWEQLPEVEKSKDRSLVRGIPRILAKAGYTMVELS